MAMVTLRQLEIFVQVVEHGSFRLCARRIGVSQVAISDHIRQLEQRLGHALFDRVPGGASVLTPAGERAHAHALRVLAEMEALMAAMGGASPAPSPAIPAAPPRRLVMSAHSDILRYIQEPLAQFGEEHPEVAIELDLDVWTPGPLIAKMREGAVDIGYFFALSAPPLLESDLVWHEPLALFAGREHELARLPALTPRDLLPFPVIRLGSRNRLRVLIDEAMDQAGLGECGTAVETDDYGRILTALREGAGFACLFESTAAPLLRAGGIARIAFDGLPDMEVRQAVRKEWRDDPLARALLARL